jgi:hypothetical protein
MQRKLELAMNPPAAHRSESQPAEAGDALPSADDLERLVRGMPAGTMETYTNTIQPLILNSCTAAGCHGPASETKYRWLRVTSGRNVNRRLTQRNLHTTMLLVNRENPDESPLLNAPAGPHGAAKAAVFTDRESIQFRQLQAWVRQVATNKEPPAQPGGLVSPVLQNPPPVANTYGQGTRPGLPQSAPSAGSAAAPTSASSSSAEDDRYAAFAGLPGAAKGDMKTAGANVNGAGPTAEGAFVPRDPFDPEIFNRRHGKGRTKE